MCVSPSDLTNYNKDAEDPCSEKHLCYRDFSIAFVEKNGKNKGKIYERYSAVSGT